MSLTAGVLLDIMQNLMNNGDVSVQVKEITGDVSVVISDGEFFGRATFPQNHQLQIHQRVCIQQCTVSPGKKVIKVTNFHAEEVLNHLVGDPMSVEEYLGSVVDNGVLSQPTPPLPTATYKKTEPTFGISTNTTLSENNAVPFKDITTKLTNFTVVGRVINRSNITFFEKEGVSKKVFSMVLQDKSGSEMNVAFFDNMVDQFESFIYEGMSLLLNKPHVTLANRNMKKSRMMGNYSLVVRPQTTIALATNPIEPVITAVDSLADLNLMNVIVTDFYFIGIVLKKYPGEVVSTKYGDLSMESIDIVDNSKTSITAKFWNQEHFDVLKNTDVSNIIFIGKCKISEIRGDNSKFIETRKSSSLIKLNSYDDVPIQAQSFYSKESFDELQQMAKTVAHLDINQLSTERKTSTIKSIIPLEQYVEKVENSSTSLTLLVSCSIKDIQTKDITYDGCEKCKTKKQPGVAFCNRCRAQTQTRSLYRVNVLFIDDGFEHWGTLFDGCSIILFGMNANQMNELEEEQRRELVEDINGKRCTIKVKGEINDYNGKVKTIVSAISFDEQNE
ncbi:Replication factor A [Entamoeba marina]